MKVFVDLYEQGPDLPRQLHGQLGPGLGTAVSDLEVEEREVTDTLFSIRYSDEIVVATVRPETMLGDTAVAVHPDDERYKHLVGTTVTLPLVGRELPVIADEYVKTDFGTGALKITPGHDPNDFEIGRKHGLEAISVIGEDGRMTDAAGDFAGLTALEAREAVVEALDDARRRDRALHAQRPVLAPLGRADRAADLAAVVHADGGAGRGRRSRSCATGASRSIPSRSRAATSTGWRTSGPWCISRQLWWGHQIPVWYRGEDEIYCGLEPPEGEGWERDPDVLDTWFSAACGRSRRSAGRDDTPELRAFYPTDVLSTARDILFLWVARMVMLGLQLHRRLPFARRQRPLGHPGARRAADVEVAGHRHRPARADRPVRRRRGALRPAGDVLDAGRALQRGEDRARARR